MKVDDYFADVEVRDWQTTDDVDAIRLAVIGLGWWSENYALPAIGDSDFCTVSVLVSGSREKATRFAEQYEADETLSYDEYHAGQANDAYDAVYIVTPNALHLEFAETAAGLEKDVLCEKPLEGSVERANRLVTACDEAGVTSMTAYRMQTDPVMRRLRSMIDDGVIGDPVQLHGGFSYTLVGGLPGQWRRDSELSGGGALADIGVYPLNTSRFLLDSDPITVQGTALSPDPEFEKVPDEHVAFQLTFPDAVTASFTASFNEYSDNRLQILGTDGQILVDPAFNVREDRTVTVELPGERLEYTASSVNEVREEFDYFAYCLQTETDPEPNGDDGVTDMRIMQAVYDSHERGERIEL